MPGQINRTLILGSFTSFMVGLDARVVATALPTLHQEFRCRSRGTVIRRPATWPIPLEPFEAAPETGAEERGIGAGKPARMG
jgi:hypothetical protein